MTASKAKARKRKPIVVEVHRAYLGQPQVCKHSYPGQCERLALDFYRRMIERAKLPYGGYQAITQLIIRRPNGQARERWART